MLTFNFYHNDGPVLAKLKLKNKIVKFIFSIFCKREPHCNTLRWLLIEWPQLSTLSIDSEKFESLENTLQAYALLHSLHFEWLHPVGQLGRFDKTNLTRLLNHTTPNYWFHSFKLSGHNLSVILFTDTALSFSVEFNIQWRLGLK